MSFYNLVGFLLFQWSSLVSCYSVAFPDFKSLNSNLITRDTNAVHFDSTECHFTPVDSTPRVGDACAESTEAFILINKYQVGDPWYMYCDSQAGLYKFARWTQTNREGGGNSPSGHESWYYSKHAMINPSFTPATSYDMEYVGCSLPDDSDNNNGNNNNSGAIFINAAAMDMGAFMAHVCSCPNSITVERNAPFRTPYILPRGYAVNN